MSSIIRKASAHWKGGTKGGSRVLTTESGVIKGQKLSSGTPVKKTVYTDPAELIAAAHANSFSLALSNELKLSVSAKGTIVTTATVTQEHSGVDWTIKNIHLNVIANIPAMTQGNFIDAALRAKTNCMVSKLLRANISMNAKLEK